MEVKCKEKELATKATRFKKIKIRGEIFAPNKFIANVSIS